MKSMFSTNSGVNPRVRNVRTAGFQYSTTDGISTRGARDEGYAEVLMSDVGLDLVMANDVILTDALDSPKDYITKRMSFTKNIADVSAIVATSVAREILLFIPQLPHSIIDDIARSVGAQVLSTVITAVDKNVSGVNDMVVNKLATVAN